MTTEKSKHLSEVLKAYSEGKTIEYRVWNPYGVWCEWTEWSGSSAFNQATNDGQPIEYRIKPEPALRPYANAQEFLKASKEHGPYLIPEKSNTYVLPSKISQGGLGYVQEYNQMCWAQVFKFYKWQDGTPCGIEECEEKQEE